MNALVQWIPVLAIAAAVGLAFGGFRVWTWLQTRHLGRSGFTQKKLLTANEVDFYRRLVRALGPRWVVMVQVSMGALMDTTLKSKHPNYWKQRQLFAAKICDFVVCDAQSLAPQLVIELDDVMHDFDKDRKRDCLTTLAGYRTLRFWSRAKPGDEELKSMLAKALALN